MITKYACSNFLRFSAKLNLAVGPEKCHLN